MRNPNEVWVDPEVFQELFAKGYDVTWRVIEGPPPEAQVLHVEMKWQDGSGWMVVVTYDRPVPEPVFQTVRQEVPA